MSKISVIVPVYKVEQYLNECIDSILNQTYKDLEIILVDDGSPDNCGKICDEYVKKDSRIKVIHKKNGGLSDARNVGIDVATGDILGFVDSDDYIDPNMFEDMITYMAVNNLDVVCADTFIVRGSHTRFRPRYGKDLIYDEGQAINEILNGKLDNATWNKIYKRKVIGNIRFPVGRKYEDVATIYKYIYNAKRVGYISKPFYYYRKLKTSITGTSFNCQSRYDCFIGYRERLEFAKFHKLDSINDCELLALETALATLTVFYAWDEDNRSERFLDVYHFIANHLAIKKIDKLKSKHKFLLWSFKHAKIFHKVYAKLSGISKRM
ncbi:glycosyltransferase family 2 protein [Veillonella intestinalis]|uniref:glycosyltransferase family 2 protein n=1 Tax=Veillonella intestinalis TaxID=2941341 RepID=UPI00203C73EC|nr:glycosyltransferase [Veillonella intestinalis]